MGYDPRMSLLALPLKKDRLHDQITRLLALEILRGNLRPDDRETLSELELSRRLKVSRTVLRESVKVLAAKGLVDVRPKVGIRIRARAEWNLVDPDLLAWRQEVGVDSGFIRNLSEVRLVAETAAAELAAIRATDEDLANIRQAYQRMAAGSKSKAAYAAADIEFHSALFAACHNDLLQQMSSTIRNALRGTHRFAAHLSPDIGLPLHKAVADAIIDRDGPGARASMEKLVIESARTLHRAIQAKTPVV
jgi:DNA-binding FadR family transcriptional regulator